MGTADRPALDCFYHPINDRHCPHIRLEDVANIQMEIYKAMKKSQPNLAQFSKLESNGIVVKAPL
jgi:hypothetical protein